MSYNQCPAKSKHTNYLQNVFMDKLTKRRLCPLQNTSPAYMNQGTRSIRKCILSVTVVKIVDLAQTDT